MLLMTVNGLGSKKIALLLFLLHVCVFRDAIGPGHLYSAETLPHHKKCPGAIQWTGKMPCTHANVNQLVQVTPFRQQNKACKFFLLFFFIYFFGGRGCCMASVITVALKPWMFIFLYVIKYIYYYCRVNQPIKNADCLRQFRNSAAITLSLHRKGLIKCLAH